MNGCPISTIDESAASVPPWERDRSIVRDSAEEARKAARLKAWDEHAPQRLATLRKRSERRKGKSAKATKRQRSKAAAKAKGRVDYYAYMRSDEWAAKKKKAFKRYGRKCSVCGTKHSLQVHHKTYDRLGSEPLSDLQILCNGCHANFHEGSVPGCYDPLTREYLALGL